MFACIEPAVHAGLVVGAGDDPAEGLKHLLFEVARQGFVSPCFACGSLGGGLVAEREQGAPERKTTLGRHRRLVAEDSANSAKVSMLLPQHGLGAAAEHEDVRPVWIGGYKGVIARR